MTFFQTFALAFFGLLLSFSSSWAVCPVLNIHGSKYELYEDATSYADELLELKQVLIELDEDVDLSDLPTNDQNLAFVNGDCEDLALFKKTIWYNNGDIRFVDFAKRLVKVQEAKMRFFLDTKKINKAMDAADEAIEIEELFEIKGSFAGLFFFFLISFLLRKIQGVHNQEKYLRSATMNFFPMYSQCKKMRLDMVSDQVEMKKEANQLFVLKGKLAISCILITLLGSLLCNEASAAPKLSVWEGPTTAASCKSERKAVKATAAPEAVKSNLVAYEACLKAAFKAKLVALIKGADKKQFVLEELTLDKRSFFDPRFVATLINSGVHLDSTIDGEGGEVLLYDIAMMSLAYHVKDGKLGVEEGHVFLK